MLLKINCIIPSTKSSMDTVINTDELTFISYYKDQYGTYNVDFRIDDLPEKYVISFVDEQSLKKILDCFGNKNNYDIGHLYDY